MTQPEVFNEKVSARYWPKVNKCEGDGCWEWNAYIANTGYGMFRVNGNPVGAHRVSWILQHGEIPGDLWVRHKCDNRRCVRPDHLELGTPSDNNQDTHSRRRWRYVPAGQGFRREYRPPAKRGPKAKSIEERFWPKVNRKGPDECWIWTSYLHPHGYGQFFIPDSGVKAKAHRIAYELTYGPIPDGLFILHSCDNRACVNPAHLRAGTHAENNQDRALRRRGREHRQNGEENPNVKITREDAIAIRRLYSEGMTQMAIATRFGIKQPQVSRIISGKSWPDA